MFDEFGRIKLRDCVYGLFDCVTQWLICDSQWHRMCEQFALLRVNKTQDTGTTGHKTELTAVPGSRVNLAAYSRVMFHHSATAELAARLHCARLLGGTCC